MTDKNSIELTDEELERVNKIVSGIQSDLNSAIEKLKKGDFEGALNSVNNGITKSNCPLCKRELGILIADIIHNKEICILKSDTCQEENLLVIDKATELKEDFVPIVQKKKAIKDKTKEQLEAREALDIKKLLPERTTAQLEARETLTLDIQKLLPPLPHKLVPKWFQNMKKR